MEGIAMSILLFSVCLAVLLFLILIYLDSKNKVPQTGWLTNNKNLFLTALKAEKLEIKLPTDEFFHVADVTLLCICF